MISKLLAACLLTCPLLANAPNLFHLEGSGLWIAPATFYTPEADGQHLRFTEGEASFTFSYPLSLTSGLVIGAGYDYVILDWKENFKFNETQFGYANFSLTGYTESLPDWRWSVSLAASLDTEEFSLSEYTLYGGVLWGRYNWCDAVGVNVGFLAELGLKKDKFWPLLGFDFPLGECWQFNLVFPIDLSIEYTRFDCVHAGVSMRFIRSRHRVSELEPLPKGIFDYHVNGVEFDLGWEPIALFGIRGYIGHTFEGDLKITNQNDHDSQHFKFRSALYGGGQVSVNF